jgi:hypothetical protein
LKKQRSIIAIAALLATAGASTTATAAGPLLSGYGGPGQGNQAILGSTLLNVPRGGSSGGPPAATGGAPAVSSASGGSSTTTQAATPGSSTRHAARPTRQQTKAAAADPNAFYAELERRASESSGMLGLTGEDLTYILIGLAVLAFGALFTRRIVRAGGAGVDPG